MPTVILLDLGQMESIGLKHLQHALRQNGISCEIIPFQKEIKKGYTFEDQNTYSVKSTKAPVEEIKKKLKSLREKIGSAKIIGVSLYAHADENNIRLPVTKFVKKIFPKATLVGGGPGINSDTKRLFNFSGIDYAIKGEGENAFPKLVRAILRKDTDTIKNIEGIVYKQNGKLIESLPARLSKSEIERLPFFPAKREGGVNIYIERGCPNACVFCTVLRKGTAAPIDQNTVIEGLKKLAKDPKVKEIHFVNDQLFLDENRAKSFLTKLIQSGLNKRFNFSGMATVESLIQKGVPNQEIIDLMKRANFRGIKVGAESLNDNIIKELKGNRYTAVDAIKIVDYLNKKGITSSMFMMAGGVNTTSREFIESYYRSVVRKIRNKTRPTDPLYLTEAFGVSSLTRKAEKEGLLYTKEGKVQRYNQTNPKKRIFVMPREKELRELFLAATKKQGHNFEYQDIDQITKYSTKTLGKNDPQTKQLQNALNRFNADQQRMGKIHTAIFVQLIAGECEKRFGKVTQKNLLKLLNNKKVLQKFYEPSKKLAMQYAIEQAKVQAQKGRQRLRTLQRGRKKFGFSILQTPEPVLRK